MIKKREILEENLLNNVLVFAAHPDDELLGVGGTIRKFANQGILCRAVIMGEGITSRFEKRGMAAKSELELLKENAQKASALVGYRSIDFCDLPDNRLDEMDLLDVIKIVDQYVGKYHPDTIFTHHHGDLNIDHRIVCEAVLTACRPMKNCGPKKIYAFETPSSTEWNYTYGEPFTPNVYIDIEDTIEAKLEGMKCYKSENAMFPHPRSEQALKALAMLRGSNVGLNKAEAFYLLREIME